MTQYTINSMMMDTTVVGDIKINDGDGCYQPASTDDTICNQFDDDGYNCCWRYYNP